ncbi:hypothetical protein [Mycoplasma sp. 613B]
MKKIKLLIPIVTGGLSLFSFISCNENKENIQKKDNESKFIFEKPTHNKYHNPNELFKEWNEIKYKKDFLGVDGKWEVDKNHLTTFYFENPFKKENSKYDFSLSPFGEEDKKHIFNFDLNHLGQFIAISNIDQFNLIMNDLRTSFALKTFNKKDMNDTHVIPLFRENIKSEKILTNNPFSLIKEYLINTIIKKTDKDTEETIKEKLKNYFSNKIILFSLFLDVSSPFTDDIKEVEIKIPKSNNLKDLILSNLNNYNDQEKYNEEENNEKFPLAFEFHELNKEK